VNFDPILVGGNFKTRLFISMFIPKARMANLGGLPRHFGNGVCWGPGCKCLSSFDLMGKTRVDRYTTHAWPLLRLTLFIPVFMKLKTPLYIMLVANNIVQSNCPQLKQGELKTRQFMRVSESKQQCKDNDTVSCVSSAQSLQANHDNNSSQRKPPMSHPGNPISTQPAASRFPKLQSSESRSFPRP